MTGGTLPAGDTLTVEGLLFRPNGDGFTNNGTINITGNLLLGSSTNLGAMYAGGSPFTNNGTLNIISIGQNYGTIVNNGTIAISGRLFNGGGGITNNGSVTCTGSGLLQGNVVAGAVGCDDTPPTITAAAAKADTTAYAAGTWTNQTVTVSFACNDAGGSGLATCTAFQTFPNSGTFNASGTATDHDGNSASTSFGPIQIDKAPPTLTATATQADGTPYVYGTTTGQTVTVHFTCSDVGSGLAEPCPEDRVVDTEGSLSFTTSVADVAGNATNVSVGPIVIVRTPPTVNCGTADGLWHATNVSIACTASDSGAGLADPADASFNLVTSVPAGTETDSAATDSRVVANKAGLSTTAGPITGNKIDRKAPTISVSTPAAGGFYLLNQAATAAYGCTDGGSGLATCSGPVANGAPLDTANVGSRSFVVTASDQVGNSAGTTVTYRVGYQVTGFLSPVKNPPTVNSATAGSTASLKWQLADASGRAVTSTATAQSVRYQKVACPGATEAPGPVTDAASSDGRGVAYSDGKFGFEWKTPRTTGCYTVTVTLNSGQTIQAAFQLKR